MDRALDYDVQVKKSEEGFAVWVPGLPGCASQGSTEEEALQNISIAIDEYLSALREIQREPGAVTRTVRIQGHLA